MSSKYFNDVGCGFIPGRAIVNVFGNSNNIQSSDTPCTLWPLKTLYDFPVAGETWWVRSTSSNDTLSGTGARTVSILTLDTSYNAVSLTINLNGLTPVVLPGSSNFRLNSFSVIDSGSLHANDGDLIVEKTGGGPVRGFILAKKGRAVTLVYTVPAGHNLWVPNFLFNMAKLGGGDDAWMHEFRTMLPNGTVQVSSTASRTKGSSEITVPSGFVIPEKVTVEERVAAVSANGLDINVQFTGVLTDLVHPSVIQRLPTAWTYY